MVPRHPSLRACYRSSKLARPRLKIHGCWAFGRVLRLAILEEDTVHGGAMVHEVLSLTLEDVAAHARETGAPMADTIVIVGDNTVKELKNVTNLLYGASLVGHLRLKLLGLLSFYAFHISCCLGQETIVFVQFPYCSTS